MPIKSKHNLEIQVRIWRFHSQIRHRICHLTLLLRFFIKITSHDDSIRTAAIRQIKLADVKQPKTRIVGIIQSDIVLKIYFQ